MGGLHWVVVVGNGEGWDGRAWFPRWGILSHAWGIEGRGVLISSDCDYLTAFLFAVTSVIARC
jgi:hypothetical protein